MATTGGGVDLLGESSWLLEQFQRLSIFVTLCLHGVS